MEQPGHVAGLVSEARRLTDLPLTVKIRLGADLDDAKLRAFCVMLEDCGVDMLSVHARLKHESFARRPRWERLSLIKNWVKIPVIANGGIFSVQDAGDCLRVSGADGLMLGRGAAERPWLFSLIARNVYGASVAEPEISLPDIYRRFAALLESLYRPERRLGRLKEFTHYFARNYMFGHILASKVQGSVSLDEAEERAEAFFSNNP
jgi:tRNA-dihydrouridine synthase